MNSKKNKIQQLTLAAFFVAIEIVMSLTPLGYIRLGATAITTMHLPVILASILLGYKTGLLTGFVFGMTSMLTATFNPDITAFCFSPFYSSGAVSGNFFSLVIAFVPRMLLGILPYFIYKLINDKFDNTILASSISAIFNTLLHTLLVLGMIALFFGKEYQSVAGASVKTAIIIVLSTNGILEIILAGLVIPVMVKALKPSLDRIFMHN